MMATGSNVVLLACQNFCHDTPSDVQETHVGEIVFERCVTVKEIKIIHNEEVPHDSVEFSGCTAPASFSFQAYALDLDSSSSRFQKLTKCFQYQQPETGAERLSCSGALVPVDREVVTNHLLFRGEYVNLSVCVYGVLVEGEYQLPALRSMLTTGTTITTANFNQDTSATRKLTTADRSPSTTGTPSEYFPQPSPMFLDHKQVVSQK